MYESGGGARFGPRVGGELSFAEDACGEGEEVEAEVAGAEEGEGCGAGFAAGSADEETSCVGLFPFVGWGGGV